MGSDGIIRGEPIQLQSQWFGYRIEIVLHDRAGKMAASTLFDSSSDDPLDYGAVAYARVVRRDAHVVSRIGQTEVKAWERKEEVVWQANIKLLSNTHFLLAVC